MTRLLGDPVPTTGPVPCSTLFIGEAPGRDEDIEGIGFVGKSGQLLWQLAYRYARLDRTQVGVANLVKIRPPDNRDPTPEEIAFWGPILLAEIEARQPSLIVCFGRFAANYLLGMDESMVVLNGRVFPWQGRLVVPVMHPAAGLHLPDMLIHTVNGLKAVKQVLDGTHVQEQEWREPNILNISQVPWEARWPWDHEGPLVLGLDTEGTIERPLSVQLAFHGGRDVVVVMYEHERDMKALWLFLISFKPTLVMHYALHDLRMLKAMGAPQAVLDLPIRDTMIDSYLLQDRPQGLKDLAKRELNAPMVAFEELVRPWHEKALRAWLGDLVHRLVVVCKDHEPLVEERTSAKTGKKLKPKITPCACIWCGAGKALAAAAIRADNGTAINPTLVWSKLPASAQALLPPAPTMTLDLLPRDLFLAYAARDPAVTLALAQQLAVEIDQKGLRFACDLDHSVLRMVGGMTDYGMRIDRRRLASLKARLQAEMEAQVVICRAITQNPEFNPGSGDQVETFLLDQHIPLHKLTKGKTRFKVDEEVLEAVKDRHAIVPEIIKYRSAAKNHDTYVCGIEELTDWHDEDFGTLHPDLKYTRVTSGRLAGFLLTFPRPDTEVGKLIRELFVARPGYRYASWDLAQMEPRGLAHLSNDPVLCDIFNRGEDIYRGVANRQLKREVSDSDRQMFKVVILAILYGITPQGLLVQLQAKGYPVTLEEVTTLITDFLAAFPGVAQYRQEVWAQTRRDGFVRAPSGRIRHLPGINLTGYGWPWEAIRSEAERQAFNIQMQELNNMVEKMLMARLDTTYLPMLGEGWGGLLLQIHDDLLFEIREDLVPILNTMVQLALGDVVQELKFRVPLKTDMKVGLNWGNLAKAK